MHSVGAINKNTLSTNDTHLSGQAPLAALSANNNNGSHTATTTSVTVLAPAAAGQDFLIGGCTSNGGESQILRNSLNGTHHHLKHQQPFVRWTTTGGSVGISGGLNNGIESGPTPPPPAGVDGDVEEKEDMSRSFS